MPTRAAAWHRAAVVVLLGFASGLPLALTGLGLHLGDEIEARLRNRHAVHDREVAAGLFGVAGAEKCDTAKAEGRERGGLDETHEWILPIV